MESIFLPYMCIMHTMQYFSVGRTYRQGKGAGRRLSSCLLSQSCMVSHVRLLSHRRLQESGVIVLGSLAVVVG